MRHFRIKQKVCWKSKPYYIQQKHFGLFWLDITDGGYAECTEYFSSIEEAEECIKKLWKPVSNKSKVVKTIDLD